MSACSSGLETGHESNSSLFEPLFSKDVETPFSVCLIFRRKTYDSLYRWWFCSSLLHYWRHIRSNTIIIIRHFSSRDYEKHINIGDASRLLYTPIHSFWNASMSVHLYSLGGVARGIISHQSGKRCLYYYLFKAILQPFPHVPEPLTQFVVNISGLSTRGTLRGVHALVC
jgi:hypothetical protein